MPSPKRPRRERTDEWASIKQWTLWPEQQLYEKIRPVVLFHETAGERAKEIDVPQRTLSRKAQAFERYGMQSLFASKEQGGARETQRRCHQRSANSLWTCTLNYLPCLGEKLPRFATFVTAEGRIIRVSNTLRPLRLRVPSSPGATSPGT